MNNFVFYSPTEFVFGKDTEIQTGTLAKKYNARKAMIVYGGGSIIRNGLLQRIEDSLQQAGVDYVKLGGVQPNPTDPKVYEGIELARKSADWRITIPVPLYCSEAVVGSVPSKV